MVVVVVWGVGGSLLSGHGDEVTLNIRLLPPAGL